MPKPFAVQTLFSDKQPKTEESVTKELQLSTTLGLIIKTNFFLAFFGILWIITKLMQPWKNQISRRTAP